MSEAYGQRLGELFRVGNAPAIVTRALRKADIAVTEIRCANPLAEMSASIQPEDAFVVALQLRDRPNREYWEDGRRAAMCDVRAGESSFHDLKRDPAVLLDKPWPGWSLGQPCLPQSFFISRDVLSTSIRAKHVFEIGKAQRGVQFSQPSHCLVCLLRPPGHCVACGGDT
jgi:hypothetical protein